MRAGHPTPVGSIAFASPQVLMIQFTYAFTGRVSQTTRFYSVDKAKVSTLEIRFSLIHICNSYCVGCFLPTRYHNLASRKLYVIDRGCVACQSHDYVWRSCTTCCYLLW